MSETTLRQAVRCISPSRISRGGGRARRRVSTNVFTADESADLLHHAPGLDFTGGLSPRAALGRVQLAQRVAPRCKRHAGRGWVTVGWMGRDARLEPEEFALAFQRLLDWVSAAAAREEGFAARLTDLFESDPSTFPATRLLLAEYDRPNLQLALDAFLARPGTSAQLLGFAASLSHMELSLSQLMVRSRPGWSLDVGPVARTMVELDEGRSLACVTMGLFLITAGSERLAVLVAPQRFPSEGLFVEVMAPQLQDAEAFLGELRRLMIEHNVYRQKVISLAGTRGPAGMKIEITFHRRRRVARDRIVLPDGVLEGVERNTLEFDRHADRLRSQGRHVRRGLLLHGPPGTGKTLTATYLADVLEQRTVLVLTGPALGLIRATCVMARQLQPSMVVLEDIDLIAEERTRMGTGATALLFELLNEIDGMGEDSDVVFVMTTNRADLIEPALAARPGRVDHAVEFPLPDAGSRDRLLKLYCEGLDVDPDVVASLVGQTGGASPAFLRELVRKASLLAAINHAPTLEDRHFAQALRELDAGGRLTRSILGAGGDGITPRPGATGFPTP